MFVGHALLAFALVAAGARWFGWDPERALRAGLLAALFATLPDVDILYGPAGLLGGVSGLSEATSAFWETGNVVHRGPTHSLVVGSVAAAAFASWHRRTAVGRGAAVLALGGLVAVAFVASGLLGALVVAAFSLAGVGLVQAADRCDIGPRGLGLVALAGLLTHPFGDLLTGTPPALLYPFEVTLVAERIVLHPDPTLHLLGAFFVELSTAWAALAALFRLRGRSLLGTLQPRAGVGVTYAAAAVLLPAPTLQTSYHFVFSVLALVGLGILSKSVRPVEWYPAACTGLAAVTVAVLSYLVAYLAV